jgi:hypothetical protein
MSRGRHATKKQAGSSTYSAKWSGVAFGPECKNAVCPRCGGHLHHEGDGNHYCPWCDDYVAVNGHQCPYARQGGTR